MVLKTPFNFRFGCPVTNRCMYFYNAQGTANQCELSVGISRTMIDIQFIANPMAGNGLLQDNLKIIGVTYSIKSAFISIF